MLSNNRKSRGRCTSFLSRQEKLDKGNRKKGTKFPAARKRVTRLGRPGN